MLEKTKGIILHAIRYGDTSMIVDIFTRERGTQTFMVRVPRSRKSGIRSVVLRPLTLVEVVFDYRISKSLQPLRDIHIDTPYQTIPFDPLKETQALFLAEFLYYTLRHESTNLELFDYLSSALNWLDEATDGFVNFHLALLIRMSRFIGILPPSDGWFEGAYYDLLGASFLPQPPVHGAFLEPREAAMLDKYLRMDYTNMRRFHFNRAIRTRALDIIVMYYRLHVPDFPEVKSLAILRELFE